MSKKDSDIIQHYSEDNSNYYGAVNPSIVQTTCFAKKSTVELFEALANERTTYAYSRGTNPTSLILEKKLAALERGEHAKVFSSGMAAITATLFTILKAGDHVLLVNNVYGPATNYLKYMSKYGIEMDNVFVEEAGEIKKHLKKNTKLIYFESPSTHQMHLLDLDEIAKIAKEVNALTMIDNTWATPLFQKPITHNIDLVIHSLTKYIGGHSDVMAGAVIGKFELIDKIIEFGHQYQGAVISPNQSWLLIRGLRSLEARLNVHQKNVEQVLNNLKNHPKIASINHPYVANEKQKVIFKKYFEGYTSLFSIVLKDDSFESVSKFVDSLKVFQIAVSWGGFESLVFPQFNGKNQEGLKMSHIPQGLVRLYIGLENPDTLIEDINQALDS